MAKARAVTKARIVRPKSTHAQTLKLHSAEIKALKARSDVLDLKVDAMGQKLDGMAHKIDGLTDKVQAIVAPLFTEQREARLAMAAINGNVGNLLEAVGVLTEGVSGLTETVQALVANVTPGLGEDVDALAQRVARVEKTETQRFVIAEVEEGGEA